MIKIPHLQSGRRDSDTRTEPEVSNSLLYGSQVLASAPENVCISGKDILAAGTSLW